MHSNTYAFKYILELGDSFAKVITPFPAEDYREKKPQRKVWSWGFPPCEPEAFS